MVRGLYSHGLPLAAFHMNDANLMKAIHLTLVALIQPDIKNGPRLCQKVRLGYRILPLIQLETGSGHNKSKKKSKPKVYQLRDIATGQEISVTVLSDIDLTIDNQEQPSENNPDWEPVNNRQSGRRGQEDDNPGCSHWSS
ncbi:hypothetical protein [Endozoicomonas euniceicola]|uniref:Uncharacterized protein n=1 Tax=Endozoicomonas euniceicola TaxID=1234143 RepID=A0ABY6H2B0_9GAMM|nr:hypothetical protein [Endozoicomonas euniceicola]UYM18759.1 hypothetical protein NX720_12910 [Endozoicomonas euniceicola]